MNTNSRRVPEILLVCLGLMAQTACAQGPSITAAPQPRRVETLEPLQGSKVVGKAVGDAIKGFRFLPDAGGPSLPLENGAEIVIDGPGPDPSTGSPSFQVILGASGRLSGRLIGLDAAAIKLDSAVGRPSLTIERAGTAALIQRPGEVQIFRDGFEAIDTERWSQGGSPEAVTEPRLVGTRSLKTSGGRFVPNITTRRASGLRSSGNRVF